MANTDTYKPLSNPVMVDVFEELMDLKEQKKVLDKKIKILEAEYKPMVTSQSDDLFFYTSKVKFSIKHSTRKGGYDSKLVDRFFEEQGVMNDNYKKDDTEVWTLRYESQ